MKTRLIITGMLLFCFPLTGVYGQDEPANEGVAKKRDPDRRLNRIIDDIIDRVQREYMWQLGGENYAEDDAADSVFTRISFDSREGAIHFTGDVIIDERDRIDGNIVVRDGSLTVRGTVNGDALVLNGSAYVEEGGLITGAVTAVNGKIEKRGGEIRGRIEERDKIDFEMTYRESKLARRYPYRVTNSFQPDMAVRDIDLLPFRLGFNRVDGFSIGLGSGKNLYWDGGMGLSLYGQIGYSFKIHKWRGLLGAARQVTAGPGSIIEFGGEVFTLTDTKDDWVVGITENDLAAFFFNYDNLDYYAREGFSLYGGYYLNTRDLSAHLRVQYINELHESMFKRTDWSLFAPGRSFRINPFIDQGRLNAVRASLNLSTIGDLPRRLDGWRALAIVEHSSPSLNSDMDYTAYTLDIRRYQPISDFDNFNVRLRVGTSEGRLPLQRVFEIGGIGTLPAFPHKMFAGNRMLLLNTEYMIHGDLLSQVSFIPGGFTLLLFLDTGWTGMAEETEGAFGGFSGFSLGDLKTSVGLGLGSRCGNSRIGFAWRTDKASSMVVFLRIARPF